jgi:hypothetical protein
MRRFGRRRRKGGTIRLKWEQPPKAAKIAQRIRKEFAKAFRALADRR